MFTEQNLTGKSTEELVKIVLEQQATLVTKDKELKDKQAEIELTAKVNEDLATKVDTLSKQVPAATETDPKSGISKETFVVEKKKYGFKKIRLDIGNQVITAAEVLASKDLQKELVGKQSGMIYFIGDAK